MNPIMKTVVVFHVFVMIVLCQSFDINIHTCDLDDDTLECTWTGPWTYSPDRELVGVKRISFRRFPGQGKIILLNHCPALQVVTIRSAKIGCSDVMARSRVHVVINDEHCQSTTIPPTDSDHLWSTRIVDVNTKRQDQITSDQPEREKPTSIKLSVETYTTYPMPEVSITWNFMSEIKSLVIVVLAVFLTTLFVYALIKLGKCYKDRKKHTSQQDSDIELFTVQSTNSRRRQKFSEFVNTHEKEN